jgi:hypothetical protein
VNEKKNKKTRNQGGFEQIGASSNTSNSIFGVKSYRFFFSEKKGCDRLNRDQ